MQTILCDCVGYPPRRGDGKRRCAHTERPPRPDTAVAPRVPLCFRSSMSRPASAASRRALSSRPSSAATSTHAVDTVRRGYVPVGFQDLFVKLRDDDDEIVAQALKTLSLTLDMATNQLEKEMLSEMVRDGGFTKVLDMLEHPNKGMLHPALLIVACMTRADMDPRAANAKVLQFHQGAFASIIKCAFTPVKTSALQACRIIGNVVRHDLSWVQALEAMGGVKRLRELTYVTDATTAAAATEAINAVMDTVKKHQGSSLRLVKAASAIQSIRRSQLVRRETMPLLRERNEAATLIFLLLRRAAANRRLRALIDEKYAPLRAEHAARREAMAERLRAMEEAERTEAASRKEEEARKFKERTEQMRARLQLGVAITGLGKNGR